MTAPIPSTTTTSHARRPRPSTITATNWKRSYYVAGQVVPNAFTVGLGAGDGAFQIYASSSTHLVVDVTGYFLLP